MQFCIYYTFFDEILYLLYLLHGKHAFLCCCILYGASFPFFLGYKLKGSMSSLSNLIQFIKYVALQEISN